MAYNFNSNPPGTQADPPVQAPPASSGQGTQGPQPAVPPASPEEPAGEPAAPAPGLLRFNSCRWQQPADAGNAAFCTHREVKPYAGTTGFDPEAWCVDCQYYKLRRAPKKRQSTEEYSY